MVCIARHPPGELPTITLHFSIYLDVSMVPKLKNVPYSKYSWFPHQQDSVWTLYLRGDGGVTSEIWWTKLPTSFSQDVDTLGTGENRHLYSFLTTKKNTVYKIHYLFLVILIVVSFSTLSTYPNLFIGFWHPIGFLKDCYNHEQWDWMLIYSCLFILTCSQTIYW